MEELDNCLIFNVDIYGKLETLNPALSRARARIFYKGLNRNRTFITEEFGDELAKTLPGTPIKGIYDGIAEDFTDHGIKGKLDIDTIHGRAYGFVSENPNISWEEHQDKDGVTRVYCCADVILWTGIYEEAKDIVGKSLSMELYKPAVTGEWVLIDGIKAYRFDTGSFAGLQVLGDKAEPCFEGAAFFTLYNEFLEIRSQLNELLQYTTKKTDEGGKELMKLQFKGPDAEKLESLWYALNPSLQESGEIVFSISNFTDTTVTGRELDSQKEKTFNYTLDENGAITLGESTEVAIAVFSIADKTALDNLITSYENSAEKAYAAVTEMGTLVSTLTADKTALETQVGELTNTVATLTEKNSGLETEKVGLTNTITTLTEEKENLATFAEQKTKEGRQAILTRYTAAIVDETVLQGYKDTMLTYASDEDFEKELLFAIAKKNPTLFSLNEEPYRIPTGSEPNELERYLTNYSNRNNGGRA